MLLQQPNYVGSPITLYAATHIDLIISSASAYPNLNHAGSAFLAPALHVLKHNAVTGIWTANQSIEKWFLKRLS